MKTFSITTIALAALISAAPAAQAMSLADTLNFDNPGSNLTAIGGTQLCAAQPSNAGRVCGTPSMSFIHSSGVMVTATATGANGGAGIVNQNWTPMSSAVGGLGVFSSSVPTISLSDDAIDRAGESLALSFDTGELDLTRIDFANANHSTGFVAGDFLEYNLGAGWISFDLSNGPLSFAPHSLITDEISFRYGNAAYHVSSITAVPEPGTYALMFAGLAALGFVARRRRPA